MINLSCMSLFRLLLQLPLLLQLRLRENRGAEHGKQYYFANVLQSEEEHADSVDSAAPACRRWHSELQRIQKLLIIPHKLLIDPICIRLTQVLLHQKGRLLKRRIILLRVSVHDFHLVNKQFESLRQEFTSPIGSHASLSL